MHQLLLLLLHLHLLLLAAVGAVPLTLGRYHYPDALEVEPFDGAVVRVATNHFRHLNQPKQIRSSLSTFSGNFSPRRKDTDSSSTAGAGGWAGTRDAGVRGSGAVLLPSCARWSRSRCRRRVVDVSGAAGACLTSLGNGADGQVAVRASRAT